MGKKRNSAKTGDQALYKNRDATTASKKSQDHDAMFNEVDRYHNQKEEQFLKLDATDTASEDDDGITKTENVLDLGLADSSEEEDDDSSQDDDGQVGVDVDADDSEEEQAVSSDSDDDDEPEQADVRDWGSKKSAYYHGDTADLEIGQEEDDAYLEEEAAKEVQAARYEQMDEDDFVLSDHDDEPSANAAEQVSSTTTRDVSKLSKADKKKLLQSHHPELLPMLTHFSQVIRDYESRTKIVAKALLMDDEQGTPEAVGATPMGLEYLVTKSMLQSSTALNVAMYLLLKMDQKKDDFLGEDDEGPSIQSHPVMARLQQLNSIAQKMEDRVESKVETLSEQVSNLIKATALMKSEGDDEDDNEESESESDQEDDEEDDEMVSEDGDGVEQGDSGHEGEVKNEEDAKVAKGVLNEARFGLRQQEIGASKTTRNRRSAPSDFGDGETEESRSKSALQALAKTVNSLEQKSATKKRKGNKAAIEALDEDNLDDESRLKAGFDMMDADLGPEEEDDGEIDDELNDDDGDEGFYERIKMKSEAKKAFKNSLYEVAPKYPRIDVEVKGERAIGNQILKNRGLVPHKAKINRNPRVKKREQYRKAIIRRKGTVRDVRTDEGHKYGGEETGIKSGLSRSRKLGVK